MPPPPIWTPTYSAAHGSLAIAPATATTAEITRAISHLTSLITYRHSQHEAFRAKVAHHQARHAMLLQRLAVLEHQESDSKMKKAQKKALRMQAEEQGRLLREEHMSLAHEEAWTSIVERDLRMFERELAKRRPW